MPAFKLAIILLSAFVIAYLSVPGAIKLAYKINALDQPDPRKVHKIPIPRLGGLAIFVAFMFCMIFLVKVSVAFWGIMVGGLIVFLVGVLDDIYQISPWWKLLGQCAAAIAAMHFGVMVHFVTNPFDGLLGLGYLSIPITFLWLVGISNAINLIDGLDGLAAGVSGIAAATLGTVALIQGQPAVFTAALVLLMGILGFLPYNFHPARIFMGDGGSNFLGFTLACLSVMGLAKSAAVISLFIPIVILGIPIFDTFFAIIRRIYNKAPIFMPDKCHLHHRLMAMGFDHRGSVLMIYGISGVLGLVAVLLSLASTPKAAWILILLLLLILLAAEKIGMRTGGQTQTQTHQRTVEH